MGPLEGGKGRGEVLLSMGFRLTVRGPLDRRLVAARAVTVVLHIFLVFSVYYCHGKVSSEGFEHRRGRGADRGGIRNTIREKTEKQNYLGKTSPQFEGQRKDAKTVNRRKIGHDHGYLMRNANNWGIQITCRHGWQSRLGGGRPSISFEKVGKTSELASIATS